MRTTFYLMVLGLVLWALPAGATRTVRLCDTKATTGHCRTYNEATLGATQTLRGHKTLGVTFTGTATVVASCIIGNDQAEMQKTMYTLTGASQTGTYEFDTNCSDVDLNVTVCTSCSVDAWLNSDTP